MPVAADIAGGWVGRRVGGWLGGCGGRVPFARILIFPICGQTRGIPCMAPCLEELVADDLVETLQRSKTTCEHQPNKFYPHVWLSNLLSVGVKLQFKVLAKNADWPAGSLTLLARDYMRVDAVIEALPSELRCADDADEEAFADFNTISVLFYSATGFQTTRPSEVQQALQNLQSASFKTVFADIEKTAMGKNLLADSSNSLARYAEDSIADRRFEDGVNFIADDQKLARIKQTEQDLMYITNHQHVADGLSVSVSIESISSVAEAVGSWSQSRLEEMLPRISRWAHELKMLAEAHDMGANIQVAVTMKEIAKADGFPAGTNCDILAKLRHTLGQLRHPS